MMKGKLGFSYSWINVLSLAHVAVLQVEAFENWSAKFLDIVLEHKCALESLKQLCLDELLKVQLQQGTVIVH